MIRTTIAAAALLLLAAPVQAQSLRSAIQTFCTSIRDINRQGMPAAPGTVMATMIARNAGYDDATYRQVWTVARSSDVTTCRSIY